MKSHWSKSGLLISIILHIAILAVPVTAFLKQADEPREKKIELVFEKPEPPPEKPKVKPKPKPKPIPRPKPKPVVKHEPPPEVRQPELLTPIDAKVVKTSGIDLPTGEVYEEVYLPPPDSVCGNSLIETGEECDDGNTLDGDGCSAVCADEPLPEELKKLLEDYRNLVVGIIEANKKYPAMARIKGLEGTVGVMFVIMTDGEVRDVRLTRPSRYRILDDEAVNTISRIRKFPPPPPELRSGILDVGISIQFKLNN